MQAGLATDMGSINDVANAIVADWNANGGVNGRKVELVAKTFGTDLANVLPDMQRVCLELTEDEHVFATVAVSWFGDAVTCMAGDHDTPLVVQSSLSHSVLDTGHDNIFMTNFMWEDALASSVRVVDEAGQLDGLQKIGVFGPLEPGMREAIDNGLAPALEAAGTELAVDGTIPFGIPIDSAAVAAVVSRFKAEQVDAVFATGNFYFNGSFMTEAQRQDYHPTYVMSDLSEGTDDLILKFAPVEQLDPRDRGELEGQAARARAHAGGPALHRQLRTRRPGIGDPGDRRSADLRAPGSRPPRPGGGRRQAHPRQLHRRDGGPGELHDQRRREGQLRSRRPHDARPGAPRALRPRRLQVLDRRGRLDRCPQLTEGRRPPNRPHPRSCPSPTRRA